MIALLVGATPATAMTAAVTSITHPTLGFSIDRPAGWDEFRDRDEPRMALQLAKGGLGTIAAKHRARVAVAHQPMPHQLPIGELVQIADAMAQGDPLYRQLLAQGSMVTGQPIALARVYDGDFDQVPTRSVIELISTADALIVLRGRVPHDRLAADWDTAMHVLASFRLPSMATAVPMPVLGGVTTAPARQEPAAGPGRFSGLWRYRIAGQAGNGVAVLMQENARLYLTAIHVDGGAQVVWRGEGEIGADIALDYEFNGTAPAEWRDGTMRLAVSEDGRRLSGLANNAFGATSSTITFEAGAFEADAPEGRAIYSRAPREPLDLSGAWVEIPPPSLDRHLIILFQRGMTVFATGTHPEANSTVAWMARGGVFGPSVELHYVQGRTGSPSLTSGRFSLETTPDLAFLAGTSLGPETYRAVQFMRLGQTFLMAGTDVGGAVTGHTLAGNWRIAHSEENWTFSPLGSGRYAVIGSRPGGTIGVATVSGDVVTVTGLSTGGRAVGHRMRLAPDGSRLTGTWRDNGAAAGTVELTRAGGEPRAAP